MNPYPSPSAQLTRRAVLRIGGQGLLGLTLPKLLQAQDVSRERIRPRARSVIFLFQWGGPSHIDMFDMKPSAPEGIKGPYQPIKTSADGIQICERMPLTARVMDKVTLVRSMHHTMKNHNSAGYYALSGHAPLTDDQRLRDSLDLAPAYGSVVDRLLPQHSPEIPNFVAFPHVVSDGSVTPGQHGSFLGRTHDPLFFTQDPNAPDFSLPELSLPANLTFERLSARRELQRIIDSQTRILDRSRSARGMDSYYDRALGMLHSERLRNAFNLSEEPQWIRDAYGRSTYGQSCLLARRLVESGVRFVSVYFSNSIGGQSTTSGGWDTHGFNDTRMFPIIEKYHIPMTEQTLPTLLNDMDARGLLEETLVIWMGEFGRTPNINKNVSRDHWPQCYTALLAGAGVKRGYVHGASDKHGMFPERNPVRPDDLAATMYQLLGINPHIEVLNNQNRPILIADGNPVTDIIA
jgi:hypothetical protein